MFQEQTAGTGMLWGPGGCLTAEPRGPGHISGTAAPRWPACQCGMDRHTPREPPTPAPSLPSASASPALTLCLFCSASCWVCPCPGITPSDHNSESPVCTPLSAPCVCTPSTPLLVACLCLSALRPSVPSFRGLGVSVLMSEFLFLSP